MGFQVFTEKKSQNLTRPIFTSFRCFRETFKNPDSTLSHSRKLLSFSLK